MPDWMKTEFRKSRATEWQKWMNFNVVVILTQAEIDEAQKAGVQILPMQWIETDKLIRTHIRGGMTTTLKYHFMLSLGL